MNELIKMIAEYFSFLYLRDGFKFRDSLYSKSFDNAFIILESNEFKFKFIREKGLFTLDILNKNYPHEWYDGSIIKLMISGIKSEDDLINEKMAIFYRDNMDSLRDYFSVKNIEQTKLTLKKLENIRSKDL